MATGRGQPLSQSTGDKEALKRALLALKDLRARVDRAESAERRRSEAIAIVGLGCRYPGGADSPSSYWSLLDGGADAIAPVPTERWDSDAYFDAEPGTPGKMYTDRGGFLSEPVDGFDADFFGITPREANGLDPQQRLLLEVAWESLEHAGIAPDSLTGSSTGVFVGMGTNDYSNLQVRAGDPRVIDTYYGTGVAPCVAAGRLSYVLGLSGPALALDTACSSSLVATSLAVESLRSGSCDMALAGGINLMLEPQAMIFLCQFRALSPTGRCHTFDAAADGYVRGEGCGLLVLKRLSDARADGDRILALIRGAAVNHDGKASGLTVPSGAAQRNVLRAALDNAGLQPGDVDAIEAHGTGTELGDPIELRALDAVYTPNRAGEKLRVGSVKTNLGHLEAAAGVAGLTKLVLSLQHERWPSHLNLTERSPHVDWDRMALEVPTSSRSWKRGERARRAGVSAFGFSGTNAHVIVEEAPADERAAAQPRPYELLLLSTRDEAARCELATNLQSSLTESTFHDQAHTLRVGRASLPHRAAVVAADVDEASKRLERVAAVRSGRHVTSGVACGEAPTVAPRLAFLFTGQGSQWAGMGRELHATEPVFREALERCEAAFVEQRGESLLEVMFADDATRLDRTEFTQPALYALQVSLARLLTSWGLRADAVLGHSVGEYAAAAVAGWFSIEQGLGLIAERGRLMGSLPSGGGMTAILGSLEEVEPLLVGHEADVSIAALNGAENTVVSGRQEAVDAIVARATEAGLRGKPLVVSHAFHSPLMDPILDAFEARAAAVAFETPRVPLYSNRTGEPETTGTLADAAYWRCPSARTRAVRAGDRTDGRGWTSRVSRDRTAPRAGRNGQALRRRRGDRMAADLASWQARGAPAARSGCRDVGAWRVVRPRGLRRRSWCTTCRGPDVPVPAEALLGQVTRCRDAGECGELSASGPRDLPDGRAAVGAGHRDLDPGARADQPAGVGPQ